MVDFECTLAAAEEKSSLCYNLHRDRAGITDDVICVVVMCVE